MSFRVDKLPFDLRALQTFVSVCDTGSMAAGARTLGMTQPAVSQAIAELESRVGTTLFDRSVRPLALTPSGGILRQRAVAILAEAHQIGPLLKETAHGRLALVRIGLVDSLSRVLTVPVTSFLSSRAEQVAVLSGLTAAHAGAMLTRQLDLFIGVDDLIETAGLERIEIASEPYILILPPGTTAPADAAALKRLASKLPLIRYSARSKTGVDIERHLRRLGLQLPPGPEFDTPFGVTAMVADRTGFAISTPLCLAEAALSPRAIAAAPLPGPRLSRSLTLVAREQELGALPRQLAATCRETLREKALPMLAKVAPWLAAEIVF